MVCLWSRVPWATESLPTAGVAGTLRTRKPLILLLGRSEAVSLLVGDTGFEPVTSSVSRKRATAAPIALAIEFEVGTGFEPV